MRRVTGRRGGGTAGRLGSFPEAVWKRGAFPFTGRCANVAIPVSVRAPMHLQRALHLAFLHLAFEFVHLQQRLAPVHSVAILQDAR
jgi:hypothetical protein